MVRVKTAPGQAAMLAFPSPLSKTCCAPGSTAGNASWDIGLISVLGVGRPDGHLGRLTGHV